MRIFDVPKALRFQKAGIYSCTPERAAYRETIPLQAARPHTVPRRAEATAAAQFPSDKGN